MKVSFCVAAVLLLVLLVGETESRSWPFGRKQRRRQRDREERPARGFNPMAASGHDGWRRFLSQFGQRFGGHHAFNFGGQDSPFNMGFGFNFGQRQRNWWEGPNVCQSEDSDNSTASDNTIAHHYQTTSQVCEESETAYRCKTTVRGTDGSMTRTHVYECCHGFSRQAGEFGCPERLRMENLPTTAEALGLKDLLTAVATVGLEEELARGNFTVFAPVDGAFPIPRGPGFTLGDTPRAIMVSNAIEDEVESELQAVLLGHLLPEPRRASSFSDEEVLLTASPYDSTIRINFYSRPVKLTTANCVPVTSTDHVATNGVIHTVEKVLPTVTESLLDLVQKDEDFSFLKTALGSAGLVSTLRGAGQFTLFAPTNAAFQKLDQGLLDRLLSGDPECLLKVLKQHVLPNVICSGVIQGRVKSYNLLNNFLNLTRTEDEKLFVNDAQVVRADDMATNGVMHVIDAVLIPDDALDLVSAVSKNGLTELVKLVQAAGLEETLRTSDNVTLFAPSNEAIQALPPALVKELTSDPALLQSVLTYHVVPEELARRDLFHDRLLDTLNAQGKVRVNEYSQFPFGHRHVQTAQCANIVAKNVASCNGVVHVIDRVMLPPSGNVVDVLAADADYSTLVRLLKVAGLADALQAEGPFTVFAPTNKAFEELGKETMKELEGNRETLVNMLKLHVFQDQMCCAGIFANPWWRHQQIISLGGASVFLARDRSGHPSVNDALIGSCDNVATNGVVHGIHSVLIPRAQRQPWFMFP